MANGMGQSAAVATGRETENREVLPGGGVPSNSASQLVTNINQNMLQLMDVMGRSKGVVSPEDQQMLAGLIEGFGQFTQRLTGAPGAQPEQRPTGNVPMEAGTAKVMPAL